jgi:sensor histidine kinase YesM
MKNQKQSFQRKLRWNIAHSLSIMTIVSLSLIVVLFILFYILHISVTLEKEKGEIARQYTRLEEHYTRSLAKIARYQGVKFLQNESSEREMYATYYHLIPAKDSFKDTRLLLSDTQFQAAFDSEPTTMETTEFANYVRTVVENQPNSFYPHVYLSRHKEHYLVFIKAISSNGEKLGYATCFIKGETLLPSSTNQIQYYIYDDYDNVFSMSTNYFVEGTLEKLNPVLFQRIARFQGNLFFTDSESLAKNLHLVVFRQENTLKTIFILLIVGMLLFSVTAFFLIRRSARKLAANSAKQVETLTKQMEKIATGETQRFFLDSGDEFEFLADRINALLDTLETLHDNNLELLRENILAEKKKLEAQFNPHFLYNTLETIRVASYYDPTLVDEMILNLNEVLRYSISEQTEYSRLAEDLTYLRHYLRIFEIRFEEFCYTIHVDEGLENLYIPKLLFLPIVENSMKYGLLKRNDLSLFIECRRIENGNISISVVDNGGGISSEIVQEVNESSMKNFGNHHGLSNSKRRFLLTYPNSRFLLYSESNETAVIMEIKKEEFIHV